MTRFAALFPGQGSHEVGMGRSLAAAYAEARQVLDEAEATLPGLVRLMTEGPAAELTLTANQQPALLACGLAAYRAFEARTSVRPAAAAGHSLGEFTALCAAGALAPTDALRAVRARGIFMQEANPVGLGAMAAVLKIDADVVRAILARFPEPRAEIANLNSPEQTVISGPVSAIAAAMEALKAVRARVIPLNISGSFHSSLMAPAAERLRSILESLKIDAPRFPVVANVTAEPHPPEPDGIRELLVRQVTGAVRWTDTLRRLWEDGIRAFVEFGPRHVLTGLVGRTLPDARCFNVDGPEGLEAALNGVNE
jgi:[acyl-carrier-protein] S-malonyltransferase